MAKRTCAIDGCEKKGPLIRGWCTKHYQRWLAHGDPNKVLTRKYASPERSLAARTEWRNDCLEWTGMRLTDGYGQISVKDKMVRTHRYAWELENGPIPAGMEVDHICHNPPCVNVNHLRLSSRAENMRNRSGPQGDSKSGVRNVHRHGSKWQVRVRKGGESHYFGTFNSIEEAAPFAELARQELFGEYAGKG